MFDTNVSFNILDLNIHSLIPLLDLNLPVESVQQVHGVHGEEEGQARVNNSTFHPSYVASQDEEERMEGGEDKPGQEVGGVSL